MSNSLMVLFKKEQLWANHSRRSLKNLRPWANCSCRTLKRATWLICLWFTLSLANKIVFFTMFLKFLTAFPLFMPKSKSFPWLLDPFVFFKERRERFALFQERIAMLLHLRSQKRATYLLDNPKSQRPTLVWFLSGFIEDKNTFWIAGQSEHYIRIRSYYHLLVGWTIG